jgi:hypothetical protein
MGDRLRQIRKLETDMSRTFALHHPYHPYHPYQSVNCAPKKINMVIVEVTMVRFVRIVCAKVSRIESAAISILI